MAIFEWRRQRRRPLDGGGGTRRRLPFRPLYSRKLKRMILFAVVFLAIVPPLFFHFKLRRIRQNVAKKCDWLQHPPRVCAHGGDSTLAFPNTVCIYNTLESRSLLPYCKSYSLSVADGCLQLRDWFSRWLHWSRCFSFLRWCSIRSPQQVTELFYVWILIIGDVLHRMITVRDLQRIARNSSVQVGDLSMKQV